MRAAIRPNTDAQYKVYIKKWMSFADSHGFSFKKPSITQALLFLNRLHTSGASYSTVASAKAALSHSFVLWQTDIFETNEHLVRKFMKGIWNKRPQLTNTSPVWNPVVVLNYIRCQDWPLSLIDLSRFTVTLIALATAARTQTVTALRLDQLTVLENGSIACTIGSPLKQSRPGFHQGMILLSKYPGDTRICPVAYLNEYLKRTKLMRHVDTTSIFIGVQKPHHAVSASTIGRWIKETLKMAGIVNYSAHSTRSASTSSAKSAGVPIATIMKNAGWTAENTFAKHYDRPILQNTFQHTVLSSLPSLQGATLADDHDG